MLIMTLPDQAFVVIKENTVSVLEKAIENAIPNSAMRLRNPLLRPQGRLFGPSSRATTSNPGISGRTSATKSESI